ncbi:MAG: 2-phospho-L-lactate guanylyltransferase [Chloroflexi bacterium 13_1_40CM_4_65_16]|nr:MAG: 2-phospho-L-lactate guanylyltransferase [Chloroflexi bacterium 13_1_40CM_66_19]OLC46129.1 MAG: 2-phospho-L-lactate guanylyltransferase [Chloroflexi bacterium 13_1_40CM_4_65_16]OLD06769.1 MAG: 2-phospho-L-lactate guanylyltransferase [Actinobacteria bacterium 13_1_40CM_3_66_19]OLD53471.1 MAG: 2-phospho-L-lactate guanylyltransferase [Actinobacteria bacterium 13_1_40CM_2_66_13]OLE72846.1 MAG: 2-phospho-L-lactate guanylyltransferase [Actinobacteria bacterium 13_1_20CM_2_66_18]TMF30243.1 MAG
MVMKTWVVVLIKDFDTAKQRLQPAMGAKSRRALARRNARRAVEAAAAGDRVLVVAGGAEVAEMAAARGAEVLVEPREEGQNVAARRGINRAVEKGAEAVLILSSDLPLVTVDSVRELLHSAGRHASPVVVAAPAIGRGGTNALYIRPPDAIGLHFGDDSLTKFRDDAESRGVRFVIHHSDAMALDLDEPSDLARLSRAV